MENENDEYFFVKSDPDHYDLADIFGGVYLKDEKIWKIKKREKEDVDRFMICSSDESDTGLVLEGDGEPSKAPIEKKRRDRLHRANSFNASDESNESGDSVDDTFLRSRKSNAAIARERKKIKKYILKNDE